MFTFEVELELELHPHHNAANQTSRRMLAL
jgi:hypothetical protein